MFLSKTTWLALLLAALVQVSRADEREVEPLVRARRQSALVCPKDVSSSGDEGRASYLLFYSPSQRKDVKIAYGKEGWTNDKMRTLMESGFNKSQATLIYAHAYMQSARSGWLLDMRSRYDSMFGRNSKEPSAFNLVFFDWSSYSQQAYASSAAQVASLGRVLGEFLAQLQKDSYPLDKVHLVSYSLSAHIAGLAGRQVKGQLGQITALDPTGVCFDQSSPLGSRYALRPADAKLVVARHYDMAGLGSKQALGGLDIFINGGNEQPVAVRQASQEVRREEALSVAGRGRFGLSHSRAAEHEAQLAGQDECQELAYECPNYQAFLAGECADCGSSGQRCYYLANMDSMRLSQGRALSYPPNTKMYIKTASLEPSYCLHHYQAVLVLKPGTPEAIKRMLSAESPLVFDFGPHLQVKFRNQMGDNKFTALVTRTKRLPNLVEINALMDGRRASTEEEQAKRLIQTIDHFQFNYMSNSKASVRQKVSMKLCPKLNKLEKC